MGRSVCGLPPHTLDFASLPARFKPGADIDRLAYVPYFFESYPIDFQKVITYLLATVIYHSQWIAESLPEDHPIFRGKFWRDGAQHILKPFVLDPCNMHCEKTGISNS